MITNQIGSTLVRTFGTGASLRKIVTNTLGDKTFTTVFDRTNKNITEREKQVIRNRCIGNNRVNTISKIISENGVILKKFINDRFYTKNGDFIKTQKSYYENSSATGFSFSMEF